MSGAPIERLSNGQRKNHRRAPLAERFWKKVSVGEADECWLWTAGKNSDGYGQIKVDGKMQRAHRLAWELVHGPIPSGMCVCHHCDCPPCVNPAHLFVGAMADNNADRDAKGRHGQYDCSGENNGFSRLTQQAVLEIRRRYPRGGITRRALAAEFGVSASAIRHVLTGRRWQQ